MPCILILYLRLLFLFGGYEGGIERSLPLEEEQGADRHGYQAYCLTCVKRQTDSFYV